MFLSHILVKYYLRHMEDVIILLIIIFFCDFRLNTHEILSILEDEDEGGDIVLHIPESEENVPTDEDSDKSDDEATGHINKLGKGLLRGKCDFIPRQQEDSESLSEDVPSTSTKTEFCGKKRKLTNGVKWKKTVPIFYINSGKPNIPKVTDEVLAVKNEVDLFKLIFTDDFMEHIVSQTNLYATQRNESLNTSKRELWVLLGGMLLSGYAKYPNKRMYWSRETDTPCILSD